MTKQPLKVVEEKFDSLEDFISEKVDEIVARLGLKIENAFEHILASVVKNTEGNLGRALANDSKKTKSKKGKCSGCNKVFNYFGSVDKHHLVDAEKKFTGICKVTDKKAKAVSV